MFSVIWAPYSTSKANSPRHFSVSRAIFSSFGSWLGFAMRGIRKKFEVVVSALSWNMLPEIPLGCCKRAAKPKKSRFKQLGAGLEYSIASPRHLLLRLIWLFLKQPLSKQTSTEHQPEFFCGQLGKNFMPKALAPSSVSLGSRHCGSTGRRRIGRPLAVGFRHHPAPLGLARLGC